MFRCDPNDSGLDPNDSGLAIDAGDFLHPANPPTTVLFDDCRKMTIHVSKAKLLLEQWMKARTKSMRKWVLM